MSEVPHPAPQPADPGRRYVTLLFADLSRSTELAWAMEAEHYAALLAALRGAYQDTIAQHGGMVVRVQGDGLLAMFGHPLTREDDGRRAVEAALALHQRVRELRIALPDGHGLSLHTGIHSGLVLIGAGDIERGRFELLGPVPNIAARLSDAAAPHEILVSEETLGPASRVFSTSAPQPLRVKGRDAPILVYHVDARAGPQARLASSGRQGPTPFVGRQAELALLEQRLAQALAGQPGSVAVAGAAGMGKTRLIEQLLARASQRGCRVLRGYCERDLGAEPLQPFRHMLQALGDEAPAGDHPTKTADDFVALFTRLAQDQALLLFVDDVQWADEGSKQVLSALRRLAACRLLILLSTRSADAGVALAGTADADAALAGAAQTITLAPLSEAEAALAIAARLPAVDPFVAAEIAHHAGGNPLFIEELCHSAARGGSSRLGRLHGGAGWLNHLVESRVQHLPLGQAELVRVAAVIGNVIPAWLLERLTDQGEDSPLVQGLADEDFIFPGERAGTLRFKHGITRDVIYDSVGLHARQRLHLRIAAALQEHRAMVPQDESLEALAYHFDAGGDAAQAAHYAELAGDKALAASSLDRARAQYRAALAALDRLTLVAEDARRWISIMHRLGLVCLYDPSRSELALSERAVRLAEQYGDAASIASARYWLGYICYSLGDTRAAIRHGERALTEARQAGEERLASQVVAMLGEAHTAAAQYGRALELLDQAITIKRRHRSGRHMNVGLAFSLVCRAYALGDRGQFTQAHECFDEALACIVGVTHQIGATTHGWRCAVLLWQGRWAEAREAATESGRIAEATRSLSQLSIAHAMAGQASWMLERAPQSLQAIVEATAWLEPRESGLYRSLNHGWLAEGLMQAGRHGEARRHAAAALQRSRERDLIGVAMSYRALARDAATQRPAAAQRYIALAMKTAQARDSAHEVAVTQLCEAEIALQQGQAQRAGPLLDAATAAFDAMAMTWHLDQALRLRARLAAPPT
ncbi:ATP-binding protein [Aquabacterium sp.]|uniref:ATP-binding protein n=1 Tax=Aquabacterium sp. TaxID=1872578 RepID=UPI002D1D9E2F|nr:AAA family ATPase [Aquabacterium sp.]HSW03101.1 AAA family ATPase [Aquabacterium sp.]